MSIRRFLTTLTEPPIPSNRLAGSFVESSGSGCVSKPGKILEKMVPQIKGVGPDTFVVYSGPSQFDGVPIVAVLTGTGGRSKNAKTSKMSQLYVLVRDVPPNKAQDLGLDGSVCNDCMMRPKLAREIDIAKHGTTKLKKSEQSPRCYVKTFEGALVTWKANHNKPANLVGGVAALRKSGVPLRIGAYGDPAALPPYVVQELVQAASGHYSGYTHAWKNPKFSWLKSFAMASCNSLQDYQKAKSMGWRTFRVIPRSEEGKILPLREVLVNEGGRRELQCPATNEAGRSKAQHCSTCNWCGGTMGEVAGGKNHVFDVAIRAHDGRWTNQEIKTFLASPDKYRGELFKAAESYGYKLPINIHTPTSAAVDYLKASQEGRLQINGAYWRAEAKKAGFKHADAASLKDVKLFVNPPIPVARKLAQKGLTGGFAKDEITVERNRIRAELNAKYG